MEGGKSMKKIEHDHKHLKKGNQRPRGRRGAEEREQAGKTLREIMDGSFPKSGEDISEAQ